MQRRDAALLDRPVDALEHRLHRQTQRSAALGVEPESPPAREGVRSARRAEHFEPREQRLGECVFTQTHAEHHLQDLLPVEAGVEKARAEQTKSAPMHKAQATSAGVISLPEAITLIRSRRPYSPSVSTSNGKLSRSGSPMSSIRGIGAAPVPPSAPSTVMKSGAEPSPRAWIAAHSSSSQPADGGDLRGDLGSRQDAALAGFRALAQL